MPEDKEWSAVAALLNEINKLKERVEALEIYTWAYMTRWVYRTSDVIWYRWSYENIWPRPSLDWDIDDTIYTTTSDNITIPLTWIGWHYGWTAYCTSSHS